VSNGSVYSRRVSSVLLLLSMIMIATVARAQPTPVSDTSLHQLILQIRAKAKILEASSGMRNGFQSFIAARKIPPESIRHSDYVVIRLLYEASRDAGFWNMHWTITNQEPNSDQIWKQWKAVKNPSFVSPTASAECDELSALYSFLVTRSGVQGVGLFWPTYNHTVAVWVVHPTKGADIRIVVPTSQYSSKSPTHSTHANLIPGIKNQFTNTHAGTLRIPTSFRSHSLISSFIRSTATQELRIPRCNS
jgi:hypothetical protein